MQRLSFTRLGTAVTVISIVAAILPMAMANQETKPKEIYPAPELAQIEIKGAISRAAKFHKRIILDFGGNWCGDCKTLDHYFHQEPNASLLKANFILVDVNIGQFDRNKDIAKAYGVPLEKGVPALVVLDDKGKPLFSQKKGEFESMSRLESSALTDFLNHWKS